VVAAADLTPQFTFVWGPSLASAWGGPVAVAALAMITLEIMGIAPAARLLQHSTPLRCHLLFRFFV
jgi:hypothetical protein